MSTHELEEESRGQGVMSFREHLTELRRRLVRMVLVVIVGFFVTWEFRVELFDFLSAPVASALADNGIYHFQALALTESISVYLKTSFIGAVVLLSPYLFWEMWAFISPGLYSREKRFIFPLTVFSVIFFLLGAAFAYKGILPLLTDWLVKLGHEGGQVEVLITLENTYNFAFNFLLMFGLVFELPLVLFFLALWGMVTGKGLLKFWRYFVVISFIVSGILTPPDPISQTFMAVPVNVLYGFGVIIAFIVSKARDSGREDAGRYAVRAMGLTMAAFALVTTGLFVLIAGIPDKPLHAYAPPQSAYIVQGNAKALSNESALVSQLRQWPSATPFFEVLDQRGYPLTDIRELGLFAEGDDVVVLVRGDKLAELQPPLAQAGYSVSAPEANLLAFGPPHQLQALSVRGAELSMLDSRLLDRLERTGPLYLLMPKASPVRQAWLGTALQSELDAIGFSLSLNPRRQLLIDLPDRPESDESTTEKLAKREARQSRVESYVEAARVLALAQTDTQELLQVKEALLKVADVMSQHASTPTQQEALKAAVAPLRQLDSTPREHSGFPAIGKLAPYLEGVSVRRDEARVQVSAELSDEGLRALLQWAALR